MPKQRPRRARAGHWYTPTATKMYEQRIRDYAALALRQVQKWPKAGGKFSVELELRTSRRMDADNVLKAALDGLTGTAWEDDSQVTCCGVCRLPPDPEEGLRITIRSIDLEREALCPAKNRWATVFEQLKRCVWMLETERRALAQSINWGSRDPADMPVQAFERLAHDARALVAALEIAKVEALFTSGKVNEDLGIVRTEWQRRIEGDSDFSDQFEGIGSPIMPGRRI